jgi:hypothetical protein
VISKNPTKLKRAIITIKIPKENEIYLIIFSNILFPLYIKKESP